MEAGLALSSAGTGAAAGEGVGDGISPSKHATFFDKHSFRHATLHSNPRFCNTFNQGSDFYHLKHYLDEPSNTTSKCNVVRKRLKLKGDRDHST